MTDYSELQKRCQRGASNLNDANNLLADCYAAIGVLRKSLGECIESLEGEMISNYHGAEPEAMHPSTRRCYDRDMAEVAEYRAVLSKEG